jgi:hypothetical protein
MEKITTNSHPIQITIADGQKPGGCPIMHSEIESPQTAVDDSGLQEQSLKAVTDESDAVDQFQAFLSSDTEYDLHVEASLNPILGSCTKR